jgi:hypothetical protein
MNRSRLRLASEPRPHAPSFETLVSSGMNAEQAARWIAETNDLRASCGCEAGAWFMAVALVGYPALWYWQFHSRLASPWAAIPAGVIFVLAAAGAGKVTGLLVAHLRLRFRLARMQHHLIRSVQNG